MNHIEKTLALSALTLLLAACGGGGGGGGGTTAGGGGGGGGTTTTTKSATIAFNIISTAKLPAPIQGVTLVARLPAGTTVATDAGSNTISSTALVSGSGISDPSKLVYGTYSAAANKVKIGIITTTTTFRGGELAKLTVTYPSIIAFTATDFSALNTPSFPLFQAAGDDTVTHSVFDLSSKLQTSLGITFN